MPKPTAYDLAHAAAEAMPEDGAARLALYNHIADAELFLLLEHEPAGDQITPQVFETEAGDYVLAFDLEERLSAFTGIPAPYAALPGRVIAQYLVGEGVGIGLNLGVADSAMLLPPEALDWLTETLSEVPEAVSGTPEAFCPPALGPAALGALLTALDAKFAHLAGYAAQALLAGVTYQGGRQGHMLAFLGAVAGAEPALAKAVGEALTFSGLEAGELDVAFVTGSEAMFARLAEVAQVFDLPAPPVETDQVIEPGAAPGMDPDRPPILR
ncbi:MAG: SseB family protein [Phaeovulum sp.]|uniref:SseB family protein n=1 Tax=Phaeovulum sp. TaxID=2934796 RepID=UPI002732E739|nr:SseB family protein [Phaeovulum sp.]MDP3860691.1 SseB family protein [Phaeovulum sp.]